MTDEKDDVILNKEDQKLSNPVTEMKASEPDTTKTVLSREEAAKAGIKTDKLPTQFELEHPFVRGGVKRNVSDENGWIDNDGNVHLNSRAKEARSKAVESDSSKAKTDTTATDKFINPFQKEKEAADKDVEDARILLDRVKQSAAKNAEKLGEYTFSKDKSVWENLKSLGKATTGSFTDEDLKDFIKDTENLAKELDVDIGDLSSIKTVGDTIATDKVRRLAEVYEKLVQIAEERVAAAETKQQEAQVNYTKVEEEAAKRKAESKPAPKAQKVAESTRKQLAEVTTKEQEAQANYTKAGEEAAKRKAAAGAEKAEKEAETKTEKDETGDPLKKAEELEEELEQKKYQTPADIKKFSNDLNRFVIQAYLNGDFGKKSNPNAIATMGFFILDKIGAALVNASEVARGMSPSAKSQWSNILDKQTELLGKRITATWFLSLSREEQAALVRSGVISGTTGETIYGTVDPNAVSRAEQRDILGISKLSQEQKGVAQSNINALLVRKSELQTLITQLKSDQGWEVYTQAMNAIVGTAKGLNSLGITDDSSSSSNKGFSDTLSANVKTGGITSKFVSGGISNNSSWNNSSAKSLSKSNSLSQDALALSKFQTGEDYAKATREAKKAANEQLIKRLENQIEIIDKCIDSWGKDLGL